VRSDQGSHALYVSAQSSMEKPSLYRLAFLDLCSDFPSTGSVSGVSNDPKFLDPLL
jgi:hypothetical protein